MLKLIDGKGGGSQKPHRRDKGAHNELILRKKAKTKRPCLL